jgi:methylisocitrate lyase
MERSGSAGARLRAALSQELPLQVVGVINAYCAILAEHVGFRALYLSGAGVAHASLGVPDRGMITLRDVLTEVRRITGVTQLPLLVDGARGFGDIFMIGRTVREMIRAGAAGIHIEDQMAGSRTGEAPRSVLLSVQEMVDRIKVAVDARADPQFVIMARTEAVAVEGLDAALERAMAYCDAGVDIIYPEGLTEVEEYRQFARATKAPILANMTEFGKAPLFNMEELAGADVGLVLYPLSAFRAMSAAAEEVYAALRREGSQESLLLRMHTRDELHAHLDLGAYEKNFDRICGEDGDDGY